MMNRDKSQTAALLKEACKATGARWAVWLQRLDSSWELRSQFGVNRARQNAILEFIRQPDAANWLAGTFTSGRTRSRQAGPASEGLGCQRIFIFPDLVSHQALAVGADLLEKTDESLFRILVMSSSPVSPQSTVPHAGENIPNVDQEPWAAEDVLSMLPPQVELEVSYNPEQVLENILQFLVGIVPCDAALMSIRSGDIFRVEALWKCPAALKGIDIPIRGSHALAEMVATRIGLIESGPVSLLNSKLGSEPGSRDIPTLITAQSWIGVPLVIGQRVIGHVAFSSRHPNAFSEEVLRKVTLQAGRLAYVVENAIVFAEAARYLQQLALLNELASAASQGLDTNEVARRVLLRLRRTFHTELAGVYLLSTDGKLLRDYGDASGGGVILSVENSLVGSVVQTALPLRLGDIDQEAGTGGTLLDSRSARSVLAVPLRYRGRVIGLLVLQSTERNSFSMQDEQLLVVIASHLAGLFENMRLNEETRERALKLQDSVRQLQAVRETALDIATDLDLDVLLKRVVHRARELVGARGAELGLLDEKEQIVNVLYSETPWGFTQGEKIPVMAGVAGRVVAFGEPLVVSDYNAWNGRLYPEKLAPFRSVCGVPLKFQGKVMGSLVVIDDRLDHEFRPEDVQLLELLAPQVTVWIRNARLYQELQERIEAQRLAENRLVRSARLAAVGEMAAGVAHEMNNPLTTIIGFVELILEDLPEDSRIREDLQLVLQESQRARSVIRRMLDFSRPQEEQRVRADMNGLVSDVLSLVHHLARIGGVEIRLELWDELPWISIDPGQIKQVLLNLIHNAIQAMPTGGVLTINTSSERHENTEWLAVKVKDTGEGISSNDLERIFEPFYTTRPAGKGTGLGLSVSYGIVNDHGGYIEVDSHEGKGSCFTIYLPAYGEGEDAHA